MTYLRIGLLWGPAYLLAIPASDFKIKTLDHNALDAKH